MFSNNATLQGTAGVPCSGRQPQYSFNCNSCGPYKKYYGKQCASYDAKHASHVSIGLSPLSGGMVEGGVFDRNFYRKVDHYYAKYGKYCSRLASIATAQRCMRKAGAAIKANDTATAVKEVEKAAVAMDANGTKSGELAADVIDKVAENMADSVDGMLDQTKQQNRVARNAVKKVEQGLNKLESGDLVGAGNKMMDVAKDLQKLANSNKDANGLEIASKVKEMGENLKAASKSIANEQKEVMKERTEIAKMEREVSDTVKPQVKQELEINAKKAIEQMVNAVVNGEAPPANGNAMRMANKQITTAMRTVAPMPNGNVNQPPPAMIAPAARQMMAPTNNNGGATTMPMYPNGAPTQPHTRAKYMATQCSGFGCCGKATSLNPMAAARHAKAVHGIYDMYGNTSCNSCASQAYRSATSMTSTAMRTTARMPVAASGAMGQNAFPLSRWVHMEPKKEYAAVVAEFGEPNWIVNQPGGQAVWMNRGTFSRIVLRDEAIPHGSHVDYLTFEVDGIDLPLEGIDELARFSESVWYDALNDTLFARCHFSGANVASLIVALDLAHDDDMTLEEAKEAYPQLVAQSKDPQRYAEMKQMLAEDVQRARAAKQSALNKAATVNRNTVVPDEE